MLIKIKKNLIKIILKNIWLFFINNTYMLNLAQEFFDIIVRVRLFLKIS